MDRRTASRSPRDRLRSASSSGANGGICLRHDGHFFHRRLGSAHRASFIGPAVCRICRNSRQYSNPKSDADDRQLALLLPARAGAAGAGDPHLRSSGAALLAVPSPDRNCPPIHALAFLLPRCGLSPSRSADYQQDGPAVWDHLGRQLHRDCRASPADRGCKFPCGIQAGFPPWLGLRRNLRRHRGVVLGSAGKVSLPLHRVENVCGDTRPLPAGLFCRHRFRS